MDGRKGLLNCLSESCITASGYRGLSVSGNGYRYRYAIDDGQQGVGGVERSGEPLADRPHTKFNGRARMAIGIFGIWF